MKLNYAISSTPPQPGMNILHIVNIQLAINHPYSRARGRNGNANELANHLP